MDLDFSGLSNDQLIQLIRAACAEAVNRGAATAAAAQDAYLSEVERARVAQAATLLETERLRGEEAARVAREAADKLRRQAERQRVEDAAAAETKLWARRKGIAAAIDATGYDVKGDQLVVWLSGANEKRVFLQTKGYGGATYVTYYVTGNSHHAPGSYTFRSGMDASLKRDLKPVLKAIAEEWNEIKVDLQEAMRWDGAAIPLKNLPVESPAPQPSAPEAPAS